jgi:uncharacterized membrane protein (UPF0127 family)
MKVASIVNLNHPIQNTIHAAICTSFFSRLRGLMFKNHLDPKDGIVLDEKRDSYAGAAIHMFFMNFDIAAIWINDRYKVVDKQIARRWRPYYAPSQPARFILELHPSRIEDFNIGDQICIEDLSLLK